jgi:hypothetical protein
MSNEIVNYDELLAKKAAELASKISKPSGDRIKVLQNKMFKFPDGTQSPGPFEAIIVDFVSMNQYYSGSFDRNEIVPPDCYSIGEDVSQMQPSDKSIAKQADFCSACPHNVWGTGPGGRGKACKNSRLLAVLPVDFSADTPLWLLQTSPTGIKPFDTYVASIAANFNAPPVKVVTTIGFDPKETYATLRFGNPQVNTRLAESVARMEEARRRLLTEPDYSAMQQPAQDVSSPASRTPSRSAARVQR